MSKHSHFWYSKYHSLFSHITINIFFPNLHSKELNILTIIAISNVNNDAYTKYYNIV